MAIGTNPSAGTLGGTATLSAVAGVATFSNLSINRSGVGYTLTAAAGGLTGATSSAFTVNPGVASALAITTMPASGQSGVLLSPQPVIRLVDALGNTVPTTGTIVTAAIASGTGTLGGTLTAATTSGIATFTNLSLSGTAGNFTLNFSSAPLTSVTSGAIALSAGAPAALAFQVQPSTVASGASIAPAVQVRVVDGAGNLVSTATNSVTISLASNPSGGVLGGTLTAAAVAGVATFSNLTIDRAGTGYALGAAGAGLTGATSAAFNVTAGVATRLAFLTQPTTTTAGAAFSPAVQVEILDAVGNRVTTATSTVTIAIGTNPGGSTLGGTASVSAVAGVATFAGVSLNRTGTGYTLDATSGGLTPATSAAFDITPGAPAVLAFAQQPTGSSVGATIAPPVTVRIQDASGNLTASTATVSLAFGANPGTATLGGTVSRAAVGGVATFNDLTVSAAAVGYTLAASSGGLTGATSSAFTIGSAASVTAILSDLPDPSVVGQPVTVGYQVTSVGGSPTGNVTVSDGAGTSCVATVTAGNCALTFLTAGARTLTATYAGDANFTGSASAGTAHTVSQAATTSVIATHTPDPSASGAAVSVTWTVSPTAPGAGTPTGNVTVSDGVNSCVAAVGTGGCSVALNTVGARSLTATYAGDANFGGSVSPAVSHTVTLAATTTTITSDVPDPSVTGQLVTVSYTVSTAIGTPTGNVTVSDGLGGSCVAAVGAGSCSITFATAGARTLTATYAGDVNFAGSASAGTPHQVNAAPTTTTITSDTPDPSVTGEPVPVNFTVISTGGTPTGDGERHRRSDVLQRVGGGRHLQPRIPDSRRAHHHRHLRRRRELRRQRLGRESHLVNQAATTTTITGHTPDPSTTSTLVAVTWTVVPRRARRRHADRERDGERWRGLVQRRSGRRRLLGDAHDDRDAVAGGHLHRRRAVRGEQLRGGSPHRQLRSGNG